MVARRSARRNARQYPRTARLNTLLQQIVAEALEEVDDERLDLLTVTAVDVDSDLNRAVVYYDSLQGAEGDAEILEALDEARPRLRKTVGREARIKRVPELAFAPDPAVRAGSQIEAMLAEIGPIRDDVPVPDEDDAPDAAQPDLPHPDLPHPGPPRPEHA
ncbi:MAG: 30S ribosome-binding factor RbfA [Acidimicrobiales bacterium]